MNLADLMLRGRGWIDRAGWPIAAIVACGALAFECNHAKTLGRDIQRQTEATKLAEKGLQAARQDDKALKADLASAKQESAVLRATLADAEKRVKDVTGKPPKVIEVVRWRTAPGQAGGEPPPGRLSLVERGDTLAIRGTSVKLETKAGNHLVTGTAQCLRLLPLPETVLYEGPFDLGAVTIAEPSPPAVPAARPWSAGVVGSIDTAGKWGAGPMIGYDFWRLRSSLGITFPDQRTVGSVLMRW